MPISKRTKIEKRCCPGCGAGLEIREDLSHGILKCGHCDLAVNTFIEEPTEEEREYHSSGKLKKEKVKYSKKGSFSRKLPFLPTTGFGKTPQEYDVSRMKYSDLKNLLNDVKNIEDINNVEEIGAMYSMLEEFYTENSGTIEKMGKKDYRGIADYGGVGRDVLRISSYLRPFARKTGQIPTAKHLEKAKRVSESLLEKIAEREGQLEGNKRDYESRLEVYSKAALIIGFLGAIFFLSPKLTGNVILEPSINTASLFGIGLFIIGLIAFFLLVRKN
jgi:hypothetical protein